MTTEADNAEVLKQLEDLRSYAMEQAAAIGKINEDTGDWPEGMGENAYKTAETKVMQIRDTCDLCPPLPNYTYGDKWVLGLNMIVRWCDDSKGCLEQIANAALPTHFVRCDKVSGIIGRRPYVVARSLKSHHYPVIKKGNRNYCDPEHAAVIWPKWEKHLKNTRS